MRIAIVVADLCESRPCVNNGSCSLEILAGQYSCNCAPGFSGKNCEGLLNKLELIRKHNCTSNDHHIY